jgi:phosphohistidine phosphatase
MKTLHLLRHAKSSRDDELPDDHERPLAPRGRRNAKAIGRYLRDRAIGFDRVRCSSARRAVETWRRVASQMPAPAEEMLDDSLYLADTDALLQLVRDENDAVASLLLVGHNPGLADLALALCGDRRTPDLARIAAKFPTGAYACIGFDGERWSDVRPGSGRLLAFQIPRDLR